MIAERTVCLKGGHVWPGGNAALREGGILVSGRLIKAILTPAEAEQAAESADEVVDVSGMVLMPPFFDGHVHSRLELCSEAPKIRCPLNCGHTTRSIIVEASPTKLFVAQHC